MLAVMLTPKRGQLSSPLAFPFQNHFRQRAKKVMSNSPEERGERGERGEGGRRKGDSKSFPKEQSQNHMCLPVPEH